MIRHLSWLLLALSLLFNVFFLAGYLRARSAVGSDPVAEAVGQELQLDAKQRATFERLRSELRAESQTYDEALALSREQIAASDDPAALERFIEREMEIHQQLREAAGARLREFAATLSPEQRDTLKHRLRRRGPSHRRLLEKYDRNGDGVLDETEQAEARSDHEAWRERRQRERAEALERFDEDGDGRLEGPEREAWLLDRFDANGNGVLDPDERPGRRRGDRRRGGRPGGPGGPEGPGGF